MSSFPSDVSLDTWKNVNVSAAAPAIVTAPLVPDINTSVASPCESSCTTTAVPKAPMASALSATLLPANVHATPVVAASPTQYALYVIVPAFQDLGKATVNCANSSLSLSKSKT